MSRYLMIGLLFVIIFSAAYFYQTRTVVSPQLDTFKSEIASPEGDLATLDAQNQAQYLPYSRTAFDAAMSRRRILFFYASWCPTCVPADADFSTNHASLPSDVSIFRVNYNDQDTDADEDELARIYGITYQHTYVQIDSEGKELVKWNGGATRELLAKIK